MFCPKCGTQIDDGSRFCPECGASLEDVFVTSAPEPTQQADAYPKDAYPSSAEDKVTETVRFHSSVPSSTPTTQPIYAAPSPQPDPEPESTKSKGGRWMYAIVLVLFAAVVFLGVILVGPRLGLGGGNDNTPSQDQPAPEDKNKKSMVITPDPTSDQASVPNVVSKSQSDAKKALEDAGFSVGSVTEQKSDQPKGTVISQSTTGDAEKGTGIDLVVSKGDKTYTVVDQACTWLEAEDYCEQHGGHLASITSQEEWEQAKAAMQADGHKVFWIGGTRSNDGSFSWIDGSPWGFTAWASTEPNNNDGEGGSENFTAVYLVKGSLEWYDCPNDLSSFYNDTAMAFLMESE